jgi:hypothetical protein
MTDENGNLSIDFLAGFTIFMVAFIWVVTMIPGLMIGLQSYTIDYDAVAYRTGVILVEDPGWPVSPPWESFTDMQKSNVTRFGLALSKDTPIILSQDKVNRFFCETAFIFPDDYRTRVIFGDYPYGFNISLIDLGGQTRSRGDALPDGHGTIRRLVKIKGTSNATIGDAKYTADPSSYINNDNVTTHVFSILIDNPTLLKKDPVYQIDPAREQIVINITDLKSTIREFPPTITRSSSTIILQNIKIYKREGNSYSNIPLPASEYPYIDGNSTRAPAMPYNVSNNVTLKFTPRFFDLMKAQSSQIYIALGFEVTPPSTFLKNTQAVPDFNNLDGALTFTNNSNTTPFNYNYDPNNVTQPYLRHAVLEVAVWSGSATGPIGGGGSIPPTNGSFTIQASAGSGGTISPTGSVIVNSGTSQTFTVTPNIGYQIADVKVDNVSQGAIAIYPFTNVVQDHTIAASFAGVPTFTGIMPVSGSILGGTFVTITGTNLTGTTGVTFDGIAATGITVVNDNTITATTPAHAAGAVTVVVTTPGGTATGTNAYTYVIPIPTFTGIMPVSGSTSGGTLVTITGTNLTGTTGVTFDGIAATGITVVNDNTITATTPAHTAGAITVVVTTPSGTATGTNAYTYVATTVVIQNFTSSTTWTAPAGVTSVEYLVVAGGGGGGRGGAGGGAGGFRTASGYAVIPTTSYTVTVGAGGAGGISGAGLNTTGISGSNSVFATITANGGGGGGGRNNAASYNGTTGGSGGGATRTGAVGTGNQGNNGGLGLTTHGGGGGGASGIGANAVGTTAGKGGAGAPSSITGVSVTYAGGGGGGAPSTSTAGLGGSGGGGNGSNSSVGSDGTANTGGGGGGGNDSTPSNGGAGGSGIVIIRYTI